MPIDILVLAYRDYSNYAYKLSRCLSHTGLNVKVFKARKHELKYTQEAPIHKELLRAKGVSKSPCIIEAPDFRKVMESAHVIHFTSTLCVKTGLDLRKKNIVVCHGGSIYRQNLKNCNRFFNSFVDVTVIPDADWIRQGAKNDIYICSSVDTNELKPDYKRRSDKIIIGHFPSGLTKGTDKILRVIRKLEEDLDLRKRFKYVGFPEPSKKYVVPYKEQIKRVNDCDIIVEKCKLKQRDKPTGSWGNTALEAAALGKIVVTQFVNKHVYDKEYGDIALHIANSEEEVESRLRTLILMDNEKLLIEKRKTRNWVVKNHSTLVTGNRLWNKVFKRFF